MIANKKWLYVGLILFIATLVLNFPFPNESPYGETLASLFNIPVRSANGVHYIGITTLTLLIISLSFLTKSVNKYQGRVVLIAIIILMVVPSMIADAFQRTLATGIYAVAYERDWSSCHFEMLDEEKLSGECELPFENFSNKDVQFTIEFYEQYYFEDDVQMVSLLNNNGPHEVNLKGNERKTVKIESNIGVSKKELHIDNGSLTGVNIVIKSGEKVRKL